MSEKIKALIDVIDHKTYENLMRLDQQLKDLQSEIDAKLKTEEEHPDEYLKGLRQLGSEVNKAIQGLNDMMNLELSDEKTDAESLEEFGQHLESNLKKISKFKDDF